MSEDLRAILDALISSVAVTEASLVTTQASIVALAVLLTGDDEDVDVTDPEPQPVPTGDPDTCGHPSDMWVQATTGANATQTFCNSCGGTVEA